MSDVARPRVSYLHGRPKPHPLHGRFAETVGGEFEYIDFRMRWQDRAKSRLYTIASWLLCAATLPNRRDFDVFLIDNLHIGPVLMKRLFLRRNQKIVVHLGSHTLYFLRSHRFHSRVEKLHLWALRQYDALLCEGSMAADIARELLGADCPPCYETFLGPPAERAESLSRIEPRLEGKRILFISGGPGEFRMHYKGLDLMVDAVGRAAVRDPELEFDILGAWDDDIIERCMAPVAEDVRERIHFRGQVDGVADWLAEASLYLHCTRGDAFPTATVEAMTAGVVPIISEWTGTRQIVGEVDDRLIVELDAGAIADRIEWYFQLPAEERTRLSAKGRTAVAGYTEESAREHYSTTFDQVCDDLGITRSR